MAFVKGKNVRLILDGKKIFHATECGISSSRNFQAIATKDTDGKEQVPDDYEWSATLSALVAEVDPETSTHHSFKAVWQKYLDGTECDLQFTTGEEGEMIFSGKVYISQADFSAPTEGSAAGSFSFVGNGTLTLDVVEEE